MKQQTRRISKEVQHLVPGDILIGKSGGKSVVEEASDTSAMLGLMRIETEHGPLYMIPEARVRVIVPDVSSPVTPRAAVAMQTR